VQFDYVRFPTSRERRHGVFPALRRWRRRQSVTATIQTRPSLVGPSVRRSFDIFGLTASPETEDQSRVWEDFIAVADVVLPMVCQSLPAWRAGTRGQAISRTRLCGRSREAIGRTPDTEAPGSLLEAFRGRRFAEVRQFRDCELNSRGAASLLVCVGVS
jgi:hypothetical protein